MQRTKQKMYKACLIKKILSPHDDNGWRGDYFVTSTQTFMISIKDPQINDQTPGSIAELVFITHLAPLLLTCFLPKIQKGKVWPLDTMQLNQLLSFLSFFTILAPCVCLTHAWHIWYIMWLTTSSIIQVILTSIQLLSTWMCLPEHIIIQVQKNIQGIKLI